LLLLFTGLWSVKTAHVLLSHHHAVAEHPKCEVSHDPNLSHIHDERWAKEDCSLCAFVVSVPEHFTLPTLPALLSSLPESGLPLFYHAPGFSRTAGDPAMRRGPPSLG